MSSFVPYAKTSASAVIEKSTPEVCRVLGKAGLRYYLYLPESLSKKTRVMVCIHGISRNAKEQVKAFSQQAGEEDCIIVAPYFSKKYYPAINVCRWVLRVTLLRKPSTQFYVM